MLLPICQGCEFDRWTNLTYHTFSRKSTYEHKLHVTQCRQIVPGALENHERPTEAIQTQIFHFDTFPRLNHLWFLGPEQTESDENVSPS